VRRILFDSRRLFKFLFIDAGFAIFGASKTTREEFRGR
jgi:hypothetical protein